ncbi:MAG TPA: RDD family protein [Pyrinomonadaceae bacterium]|nr:RDD family protein [Pyrinomonadaceae bacterium]
MTNENSDTVQSSNVVELAPPFLLRVGAALIDYIVFLFLPLASLVTESLIGGTGLGIASDRTVWFLAFVIGFVNCVFVPQIGGQSIGKMLTGIRIVSSDLSDLGRIRLLLRQTLGYLLTIATLGLGFLAAAVLPSGRSLHDAVLGTATVRARKSLVEI